MDAISNQIQAALELFEGTLGEVRFADIDAKTLARAAADVNDVATRVAAAQVALDSARAALDERQNALLEQVQRALAYARVYAENDEGLRRRLDAIRLPRPGRASRGSEAVDLVLSPPPSPTTPGRRGRPRKASTEQMHVPEPPLEGSGQVDRDDDERGAAAVRGAGRQAAPLSVLNCE